LFSAFAIVSNSAGVLAGAFPAVARRKMPNTTARKMQPAFTLAERFEFGNFSIPEICELKKKSRTGVYEDAKAGLVEFDKDGRKTIIRGRIAKRYITGEPIGGRD
jgi:hypothetical protein